MFFAAGGAGCLCREGAAMEKTEVIGGRQTQLAFGHMAERQEDEMGWRALRLDEQQPPVVLERRAPHPDVPVHVVSSRHDSIALP